MSFLANRLTGYRIYLPQETTAFIFWGRHMSYRVIYNETSATRAAAERRRGTIWTEEFPTEHQAMGRARELLETGEHHGIAVHDHSGQELSGVWLQWRLGGFSGD
jgi:hypothetical protein